MSQSGNQSVVGGGATNPLMVGGRGPVPRPSSPVSEQGDAQYTAVGARGLVREDNSAVPLLGRSSRAPDRRKFKYDVLEGRSAGIKFAVTRDDRMSAEEAGAKLAYIHRMMDVHAAEPEVLYAFDRGLFFCHTVNGGSTLNPGRSKWSVPGKTEVFDYAKVVTYLNADLRRFFRAFADDITAANKYIMDTYDPYDYDSVEHHGWLMEVAAERGLTRYPHLAHDSADACTELSVAERMALIKSKSMVISSSINSADRALDTSRVMSADRFDSTTRETIPARGGSSGKE